MRRGLRLRGLAVFPDLVQSLQNSLTTAAQRLHFVDGVVEVALQLLCVLFGVLTEDRSAVLEDIVLLGGLLRSLQVFGRAGEPDTLPQELIDPAFVRPFACRKSATAAATAQPGRY